jgi:hypothetical protein
MHGEGRYSFTSGTVYEGEYYEGLMQGQGTCCYASGAVYSGQWYKDKRHGYGKFIFAQGHNLVVQFHNVEMMLKTRSVLAMNTLMKENSDNIESDLESSGSPSKFSFLPLSPSRNDHMNNNSQELNQENEEKNGGLNDKKVPAAMYEGEFEEGLMHGRGVYSFPNGDIYEGSFVRGSMHGQGKLQRLNGDYYEVRERPGLSSPYQMPLSILLSISSYSIYIYTKQYIYIYFCSFFSFFCVVTFSSIHVFYFFYFFIFFCNVMFLD